MEGILMDLKILLPYKVFAEVKNVKAVTADTNAGSYGFFTAKVGLRGHIGTGDILLRNKCHPLFGGRCGDTYKNRFPGTGFGT